MLIILATLLLWTPAVFGYGIVLVLIRKKLNLIQRRDVFAEAVCGMFLVSALVNVIHFFHALDQRFTFVLALFGWLCFVLRFRVLKQRISFRTLGLLAIWTVALAFWSTQSPRNPDAGLYHLQAIKWINLNQLPFGLGNLHDRLGFNSTWFSLAAALQLPAFTMEGGNALSVSALLTFFFGIEIFHSIRQLKASNPLRIHHLFLSLAPLMVLSDITRRTVSSPSPDYAVMVLCVAVTYYAMELVATSEDWTYRFLRMLLIVLFGVTIKQTAIPLMLVPMGLFAFALRRKIPIDWKRVLWYAILVAGLPIVLWLLRAIGLSGYLSFPIKSTSFQWLPWTVPSFIADHQWLANQTSARLTYPKHLSFSEWIGPWFFNIARTSDFILFSILILTGLFLLFFRRSLPQREFRFIFVPLAAGILCWFLIGPDLRFGAGYIWAAALLTASAGVAGLSYSATIRVILVIFLICSASFIPRAHSIYFGLPPVRSAIRNPREFLFHLTIPKAQTTPYRLSNGITVHVPNDGTQNCWLSDLPCAPFPNPNLVAVQNSDGSFKMFYIARTN